MHREEVATPAATEEVEEENTQVVLVVLTVMVPVHTLGDNQVIFPRGVTNFAKVIIGVNPVCGAGGAYPGEDT